MEDISLNFQRGTPTAVHFTFMMDAELQNRNGFQDPRFAFGCWGVDRFIDPRQELIFLGGYLEMDDCEETSSSDEEDSPWIMDDEVMDDPRMAFIWPMDHPPFPGCCPIHDPRLEMRPSSFSFW
jgi:hypothetical protein